MSKNVKSFIALVILILLVGASFSLGGFIGYSKTNESNHSSSSNQRSSQKIETSKTNTNAPSSSTSQVDVKSSSPKSSKTEAKYTVTVPQLTEKLRALARENDLAGSNASTLAVKRNAGNSYTLIGSDNDHTSLLTAYPNPDGSFTVNDPKHTVIK